MLNLIFSPKWFYGKDIVIDLFSFIVLTLIATFSLKYYKLNKKNKNYLWFGISFILLGIAFLFKILTNFTIYYDVFNTNTLGSLTLTYKTIMISEILFSVGFFFYISLTLLGFLILYWTYQKQSSKQNFLLMFFFILTISFFSTFKYFIFHLTSFLFIFLVTLKYIKNYNKNKKITSKLLLLSFSIITISQLVFMFVNLNNLLYVIAEIIQLLGYILLLVTFIGVVKNAKKK